MRNRVAILTAISALALALTASPALAANPAVHGYMELPVGESVACGATTYHVLSGGFFETEHFTTSASGNFSAIETLATRNLVVENDAHEVFDVVGVERFGLSLNAAGAYQETWVFKLRIVGTGDSINAMVRFLPPGGVTSFDIGSCPLQ